MSDLLNKYKDAAQVGIPAGCASAIVKEIKDAIIAVAIADKKGREKTATKKMVERFINSPFGDIILSSFLAEMPSAFKNILKQYISEDKIEFVQSAFRVNSTVKVGEMLTSLALAGGGALFKEVKGKFDNVDKVISLAEMIKEPAVKI
jgi:hypothetical protein